MTGAGKKLDLDKIIEEAINVFHKQRLDILEDLELPKLLKKNPYLYRARNYKTPEDLINALITDFSTSSDETIFGDFFETVGKKISDGKYSGSTGADFDKEDENEIHVYAMKSSNVIFNASATKQQQREFTELQSRLRKSKKKIDTVLAYGYGRKNSDPTGSRNYRIASGQSVWEEISGDSQFYIQMIEKMNKPAEKYDKLYTKALATTTKKIMNQFRTNFISKDGQIDWKKWTEWNSGKEKRIKLKKI